ncbi:tyrosine decarboxylase 2 isoform X2 [Cryptomeria japonica]|uniref:tyrosine decarboxylase 2 isoform X2 n=1 Tax=Cryptomeria japonica TaxID=3369 RepID=UPI0027DA0642|nr:tyrosine decarboxylase 2 isoform X2 [Cryptomeria japonica]
MCSLPFFFSLHSFSTRSLQMNSEDLLRGEKMNGNGSSKHKESNGKSNQSYLRKPLDVEEFRKHAHAMVDFIADYYHNIENFPVLSQVQPDYLKSLIPDSAPQHPESFESVLADVKEKIMPGLTHWYSPNFYAYFCSSGSTASFLGEMLSSGFATVGLSWITSPAATELETIVLDWLAKMLNLPKSFLSSGKGGGVIQGSASEAVLVSLLAARDKVLKKIGAESLSKLVVYVSDQTHSSIEKACRIAGIHQKNVRVLSTDSSTHYALSLEIARKYIVADICDGLHPLFLCATIGTTSTTAVDPLYELAKLAREHDIWLHVDAAYAGSACICPEYQHYLDGLEDADSFNMNPHKWLLTNFDCSALWVKASDSKLVIDYKDWQIPLGSRFRSLKLWMVLRLYGISNLQAYIRNHIGLAQHFENLVTRDNKFEVMAPRTFALVCFRVLPPANDPDDGYTLNSRLLDAVNESGHIYLSHTASNGDPGVGRSITWRTLVKEDQVRTRTTSSRLASTRMTSSRLASTRTAFFGQASLGITSSSPASLRATFSIYPPV